MSSLSRSTENVRKVTLLALLLVVLIMVFDFGSRFVESVQPLPSIGGCYAAANGALGAIPVPEIPSLNLSQSATATYTFNNRFPNFPPSAQVYSIDPTRINLETVPTANRTAAALGFTNAVAQANNTQFSWSNASNTKQLTFNANTGVWQMTTQYFFDPQALLAKTVNQNSSFYIDRARQLVSNLSFTNTTLQNIVATSTYALLNSDGNFTSPLNPASANYVFIDIFRNLPATIKRSTAALSEAQANACNSAANFSGKVYKTDPRKGSLRLVVSGQVQNLSNDIYALDFTDFRYSGNAGIYNILSVNDAYSRLQRGEGKLMQLQLASDDALANNRNLNVTRFSVNADQTELAYFETDGYSPFAFPIFVFRGVFETAEGQNGRFVFYVDALQRFATAGNSAAAN